MEFFEALVGCAIKCNENSQTSQFNHDHQRSSFKNHSQTQILDNTADLTSRPSSKSQYPNSKSESKTDYLSPQNETKTETNGEHSFYFF